MRSVDVDAIREALDSSGADAAREKREFRLAETWRDRLLEGDADTLQTFSDTFKTSTREIEKLIEQYRRVLSDREQKRLNRELFRAIKTGIADRDPNQNS
jgi:ribosome-associated protein